MLEFLLLVLGVNSLTFAYYGHKFIQFRKNEKYRTQELNHRVQCMLDEMERDYQASLKPEEQPVTNIFREHVIEEVSKHRLIYDEATGRYIKLRQIK